MERCEIGLCSCNDILKMDRGKVQNREWLENYPLVFFGFVLSLSPLTFAILQDCMTVKMTVADIREKYAPDFMLAVFAVAVNMGACTVSYSGKMKIGRFSIAFITVLCCVFAYTHLHNQNTKLISGYLEILCNIAIVVLIINTLIGIFLQIVPEEGEKITEKFGDVNEENSI